MAIKIADIQAFRRLSCGADVSFYFKVPKRIQQSLTLLHSEQPKLFGVLAVLSAKRLSLKNLKIFQSKLYNIENLKARGQKA